MIVVESLKAVINALTAPELFISVAAVLLLLSLRFKAFWKPRVAAAVGLGAVLFVAVSMLDPNFAKIVKKPDNIPIILLLLGVTFYTWMSLRSARRHDKLIAEGRKKDVLRAMQD